MPMPAPKDEPHRKISLNVPTRLLDRLDEYPGEQTWKIVLCLEYALKVGALMSPEEAGELLYQKALQLSQQAEARKKMPQSLRIRKD
jgi:hypothetical protein